MVMWITDPEVLTLERGIELIKAWYGADLPVYDLQEGVQIVRCLLCSAGVVYVKGQTGQENALLGHINWHHDLKAASSFPF